MYRLTERQKPPSIHLVCPLSRIYCVSIEEEDYKFFDMYACTGNATHGVEMTLDI